MRSLYVALLITTALVPASRATAAVYHVAPGGSDAADGSAGAPWATLGHAADSVAPGDEVMVEDGSYAGFQLSTSGTPAGRIVFRAMGGGAVIDADGPTGDGIRLQNVSHVTIEGITITGSSARGIAHRGASPTDPSIDLIIRGNTVRDTEGEGMYLSEVSDSLVEGNTISGAGVTGTDRTHCIYLANAGSDGTTLRGNDLSRCGTAGIHFNGDLSVGGDGVISGLVVENNRIHDNGQNGLNMDGVQDSIVRNNVIWNNASNGLRAYAIDGAEGPRGLIIVNNTCRSNGWSVRLTEDLGGNVVFNNILMSETGSIALDGTMGFASSHNAVVDAFTPDRDTTMLDLAAWQALGYDEGSFVATPAELFVSDTDLHLRAGAPAIDAGVPSFDGHDAPAADAEGNARDGAPDLGAYEHCEAGCTTAPDAGTPPRLDGGVGPLEDGGGPPGTDAGSSTGDGDGGCGCDVPAGGRGHGPGWALVLLLLCAVARRRRCRGDAASS